MRVFHNFHGCEMFKKSLNTTFIALIPKKIGQLEVKDFRPISLVGSVYKILAKVLAIRMKQVLGLLISNNHNAFTGGDIFLTQFYTPLQPIRGKQIDCYGSQPTTRL
jgi:hypothetical protein